jgi:hypothetical protein
MVDPQGESRKKRADTSRPGEWSGQGGLSALFKPVLDDGRSTVEDGIAHDPLAFPDRHVAPGVDVVIAEGRDQRFGELVERNRRVRGRARDGHGSILRGRYESRRRRAGDPVSRRPGCDVGEDGGESLKRVAGIKMEDRNLIHSIII